VSSVSSGAGVNANPRRNRDWQQGEEQEQEEDANNNNSNSSSSSRMIKGMEVMDHATQATKATQQTSETSSSSFVSLNSTNVGINSESATGLFQVASIGSSNGNNEGNNTNIAADNGDHPDSLRGDSMPKHWHWQANQPDLQRGGILGSIHEARQGLRTTPGTFLPALHSGSDDDLFSSSRGSNDDDDDEISVDAVSVGTSGSDKLWDRMESNQHIMESKESKRAKSMLRNKKLAERKVMRRKMYVRRIARAVVLGVALTTLSASAVYFVVEEDIDEVIPSAMGFLASLFDNGGDASNEEVEEGTHVDLRYRKLPIEGGVHQDILQDDQGGNLNQPALTGDQGNQQSNNSISLEERKHMAREESIERNRMAREGRILAREERLDRGAAQQENALSKALLTIQIIEAALSK